MLRGVLVLAAAALALAACGSDEPGTAPRPAEPDRVGSPEALASLKAQANELLDGGTKVFEARLATLRGHPVVVNQWASWCGPCRFEFPFFQRLANTYDGRVAFLGVNSQDSRDDAAGFLKRVPVPYPHYYDKDVSIARVFRGGRAWPTTAYYAASGELAYTHAGAYASERKLEDDVRRYALGD
jgi:cytochrome c biogenesis protein CcmG/thiol:disulfide interchange protein DsbE